MVSVTLNLDGHLRQFFFLLLLFKEVNYFLKQRNVMFISWDHLLTQVKLARRLQSNSTVQAGQQTRLVMN